MEIEYGINEAALMAARAVSSLSEFNLRRETLLHAYFPPTRSEYLNDLLQILKNRIIDLEEYDECDVGLVELINILENTATGNEG